MEGINFNQIGVSFKGSGSYVPDQILTNQKISQKVDTSNEWIKSRTGISERRISGLGDNVTEMGYKAALTAIEMASWDIKTIDLIVLATSTPHDLFGSAPSIQAKLGAANAVAFDLTAACSGFLFALITASQFLKGGSFKRAIVIGADQLSSFVDWNDRRSCILFGDGAGALAIEATNEYDNFIGFDMRTDGLRGSFLNLPKNNDALVFIQKFLANLNSSRIGKYDNTKIHSFVDLTQKKISSIDQIIQKSYFNN